MRKRGETRPSYTNAPSPTEDFTAGGSGRGIQESLYGVGK
jgi:hypothetical protein